MRIALIHLPPQSEFDKHWARFPVLGLSYIAACLRRAGHEVILLDGKLDDLDEADIVEGVVREQPDLVGITCMTVEFPAAVEVADNIRQKMSVPIAVGGAHINAVGAAALRECDAFDYGCMGEGEYLINELVSALKDAGDLRAIKGLIHRYDGEVVTNTPRPYPKDYDELPMPAWDLFNVGDQIPLLTHRGCPFQCTFCGHNSGFKVRYHTPERVVEEISQIVENFAPKVVRFEDETFGLHMKRTKAILQGILDRGLHKKVAFSAQTRVDRIDPEFIDLLKRANFETLELGVESGNPEILKGIKKGITLDQVEYAVKLAKQADLLVWCKFILGHPHETVATIRDTVNFIVRINPDRLSVSTMTPFPGTPIYDMAIKGEGGYRMLGDDWRSFDKYSTGILELENVSLGTLKAYQIWCYLKLYLWNARFSDLFGMVLEYRQMATEMLVMTSRRLVAELAVKLRMRPRVSQVS